MQISTGIWRLCQFFHQFRILRRGQSVADALGFQIQRAPNGFRAGIFAGVRGQAQAVVCGIRVGITKKFGRSFLLIAAHANGGDMAITATYRPSEDIARCAGAEVADRIENPEQGNAEVALAPLAATFHAFEDGRRNPAPPQAHSHRYVDFGMKHVLGFELSHQPVGNDFIVLGSFAGPRSRS